MTADAALARDKAKAGADARGGREPDLAGEMDHIGRAARAAAAQLALANPGTKTLALEAAAAAIRHRHEEIRAANAKDMAAAREKALSPALLDRLALDERRIEAMAQGLEAIARLPDPIGRTLAEWQRPNGLQIARVSVPLGVIGIIYESRPNVTADAGGLCLKSGNAVILRGGSESFHSSAAIHACLILMSENVRAVGPCHENLSGSLEDKASSIARQVRIPPVPDDLPRLSAERRHGPDAVADARVHDPVSLG